MRSKPKRLRHSGIGVRTLLRDMADMVSRGGESVLSRRRSGRPVWKQSLSVVMLFVPYILMLHCRLEVFGGRRASIQ